MGWRGPWGTTYPTNLRLYFQEITEGQWVQIAKEMQRRPPMPYFSLNAMSQADVRAMYAFIRSLGPAGKPAPAFVPPDKVPTTALRAIPRSNEIATHWPLRGKTERLVQTIDRERTLALNARSGTNCGRRSRLPTCDIGFD